MALLQIYVDDCGISATSQEVVDDLTIKLRNLELKLTQEKTFEEFLEIKSAMQDGQIDCSTQFCVRTSCHPAGVP